MKTIPGYLGASIEVMTYASKLPTGAEQAVIVLT